MAQLVSGVRARASGAPRARAADPVERGAREAADGVRRRLAARRLPARHDLDSRVPGARRARAARRLRRALARRSCPTTTSRASGTPTRSTARASRCPGTSTRACSSTAATCSRMPASRRRRAPGASGATRCSACSRTLGDGRHAIFVPLSEWEVPVVLAFSNGAELLRDGDTFANFQSDAFRTAFAFYLDLFARGFAARTGAGATASVYRDFAEGWFCFYLSGPWNLGEFAKRLPPELAGAWSTAPLPGVDARRPGVSLAGGASLAIARVVAAQGRGVAADRVARGAGAAGRVLSRVGRPAAAPQRVAGSAARGRRARAGVPRPARTRARGAEGARVGAHRREDLAHAEAAVRGERSRRRRARRARRGRRRDPREAPLAAPARAAGDAE